MRPDETRSDHSRYAREIHGNLNQPLHRHSSLIFYQILLFIDRSDLPPPTHKIHIYHNVISVKQTWRPHLLLPKSIQICPYKHLVDRCPMLGPASHRKTLIGRDVRRRPFELDSCSPAPSPPDAGVNRRRDRSHALLRTSRRHAQRALNGGRSTSARSMDLQYFGKVVFNLAIPLRREGCGRASAQKPEPPIEPLFRTVA